MKLLQLLIVLQGRDQMVHCIISTMLCCLKTVSEPSNQCLTVWRHHCKYLCCLMICFTESLSVFIWALLLATTCYCCWCRRRNLLSPAPISPTMLLQVCVRAIYSRREDVFEAQLSPVYDGMCFGNGSIHTALSRCVFAAAGGNQAVKVATSGRK